MVEREHRDFEFGVPQGIGGEFPMDDLDGSSYGRDEL